MPASNVQKQQKGWSFPRRIVVVVVLRRRNKKTHLLVQIFFLSPVLRKDPTGSAYSHMKAGSKNASRFSKANAKTHCCSKGRQVSFMSKDFFFFSHQERILSSLSL
jgi:hypothetical protein